MNNNIWRMNKQGEQYKHGKTTTQRAMSYIKTWESRCYSSGIPDEASRLLMDSGRVPSYKAIAECILKNDLHLYGLGFMPHVSHWYKVVKKEKSDYESDQMKLI